MFSRFIFYFILAPSNFLLFSQKANIRRATFASEDNPDLVLPTPSYDYVKKIDFNFKTGLIYWIESETKSIKASMEDGSNDHLIYNGLKDHGNPYDITVDSYAGSLYFTDSDSDTIRFMHLSGDKVATVIFKKKKGYKPRSIVVSSEEGYVYTEFRMIKIIIMGYGFGVWIWGMDSHPFYRSASVLELILVNFLLKLKTLCLFADFVSSCNSNLLTFTALTLTNC